MDEHTQAKGTTVGHITVHGSQPWCLDCAGTADAVRDHYHLEPGDDDLAAYFPVNPVEEDEALAGEMACTNCGEELLVVWDRRTGQ